MGDRFVLFTAFFIEIAQESVDRRRFRIELQVYFEKRDRSCSVALHSEFSRGLVDRPFPEIELAELHCVLTQLPVTRHCRRDAVLAYRLHQHLLERLGQRRAAMTGNAAYI